MTTPAELTDPVPSPVATGVGVHERLVDVVRVAGPDAERFLQGQLSQDVSALAPGDSARTFLLEPQGKVTAWLRVTRVAADDWILDVDEGHGPAVDARLRRFLLRTDCTIDVDTWPMQELRGPGASAIEVPLEARALVVARTAWPGVDAADAFGPDLASLGTTDATWAADIRRLDVQDRELVRIIAGVPAMGREIGPDSIPAETGLVEPSVSFTKGCFTGQELVARMDARGNRAPRRVVGVIAGQPVSAGQRLTIVADGDDAVDVGEVTSAGHAVDGRSIGLALLARRVDALPASVAIGPVGAIVVGLPLPSAETAEERG